MLCDPFRESFEPWFGFLSLFKWCTITSRLYNHSIRESNSLSLELRVRYTIVRSFVRSDRGKGGVTESGTKEIWCSFKNSYPPEYSILWIITWKTKHAYIKSTPPLFPMSYTFRKEAADIMFMLLFISFSIFTAYTANSSLPFPELTHTNIWNIRTREKKLSRERESTNLTTTKYKLANASCKTMQEKRFHVNRFWYLWFSFSDACFFYICFLRRKWPAAP